MANPKAISRETRICLALWRKAWIERDLDPPQPVTINCANFNAALSLRQSMYKSIKPFRDGSQFDEDLRRASESFTVKLIRNDNPHSLHQITLVPRSVLNDLEDQLDALGIAESDLLLPSEKTVDRKLSEFLEPPDEPERSATPFYTRD